MQEKRRLTHPLCFIPCISPQEDLSLTTRTSAPSIHKPLYLACFSLYTSPQEDLSFNNLYLLAPGGIPLTGPACLYTPHALTRFALEANVKILDASMVALDRASKTIALSDGGLLAYDYLVIGTGLQDQVSTVCHVSLYLSLFMGCSLVRHGAAGPREAQLWCPAVAL